MSVNGTRRYDVGIMGAGQGGRPLAIGWPQLGAGDGDHRTEARRRQLCERRITPTKTMVASARAAYITTEHRTAASAAPRRVWTWGQGLGQLRADEDRGGRLIWFGLGGASKELGARIWMLPGAL